MIIKRYDAHGGGYGFTFMCPGCEDRHSIRVREGEDGPRPSWTFNGDLERPTFTPSILVTYNGPDAGQVDEDGFRAPPAVCHSYVTDGSIRFLDDCTHPLAGQVVPLPELEA